MKKHFNNNKKLEQNIKKLKNTNFLIKCLVKNEFVFLTLKNKIFYNIKNKLKKYSINILIKICFYSYNKKQYNKFTFYSRYIFLKLIQNGFIFGLVKSIW